MFSQVCIHFTNTMSHIKDWWASLHHFFISQFSISDKETVGRSCILDPRFYEEGDSCMADKGFTITDDLKALNIELNIPVFLSGRYQLMRAEVKKINKSQLEHAMRRITTFRLIRNEIPLAFYGSINHLWAATSLLCNLI